MKRYLIIYAATAVAMLVLDGIWLSAVAKEFYKSRIGHLMAPDFSLPIAGLFYILYVGGVVLFAGLQGAEKDSVPTAALYGALFGFFCYATYDLTNAATLRNWPVSMTIVDIAWGVFITAAAASAGVLALRWFGR